MSDRRRRTRWADGSRRVVRGALAVEAPTVAGPGGSDVAGPLARQRHWLRWATALTIVVLLGTAAWFSWDERQQELGAAADQAQRRAERMAREIELALHVARLAIAQTEARLARLPPGAPLATVLGDLAAERAQLLVALPVPFEVHLLDADGHALDLAPGAAGHAHGFPGHDHAHRVPTDLAAGWSVGVVQGEGEQRIVPLLRRAAPNPHGVVAYAVDFSQAGLRRAFDASRVADGGTVTLVHVDPAGPPSVLVQIPSAEAALQAAIDERLAAAWRGGAARGQFDAVTGSDGVRRVGGWRRLDDDAAALAVVDGVATAAVLQAWTVRQPVLGALVLGLAVLIALGGRRLERSLAEVASTQQQLRRSEAHFRGLAEGLPDIVGRMDAEGRYLYMSPAVMRATGLPPSHFVGKTAAELGLPPHAVQAWMAVLRRVFASGRPEAIEVALPGPQGLRHWESNCVPETDAEGRVVSMLFISRDVTERRRLEDELRASEQRFRLAASFGHVWEWDIAAGQARFTDALWHSIGHPPPPPEASVAAMEALVDDAGRRARHAALAAHLRDGKPYEFDARIVDASGRERWFHTQGQALRDAGGRAVYMAGTIFEITERRAAEQALRASEARLAFLLRAAPVAIYTARADGDYAATYISPNVEALCGWTPQQIVHDPRFWVEHVHPDDRDALLARMAALAAQGDEATLEYRFAHRDGGWRWLRDSVRVVRDDAGRALELVGAWLDITPRREAEDEVRRLAADLEARVQARTAELARSEARWRQIFETVPVALGEEDWGEVKRRLRELRAHGVTDAPAYFARHPAFVEKCLAAVRVRQLNRKALELHDAGDRRQELQTLRPFFPGPDHLDQFVGELEALWRGERLFTARRALPSIGGRPLSQMLTMSLPALDDDGDDTALVCLVDISELDRLDQELAASVARLRAVNRELETFTYSVSHDLKAPLRGIDGYSRLLIAEHAQRLDDEARQFVANIRLAARQMGVLIDDLLSYSRLERRELAIAAVALAPLAEQVVAGFAAEVQGGAATVHVAVPPQLAVRADLRGLTLALRNLVDNAFKFAGGRPGARIEIGAGQEGSVVRLTVRDNGPGFDMKFHDRIFSIFQRLHRAEEYPGTGIGLAIVRKAMERMGGRVWATSAPGAGATFTLELPAATP